MLHILAVTFLCKGVKCLVFTVFRCRTQYKKDFIGALKNSKSSMNSFLVSLFDSFYIIKFIVFGI